jgi:hypothetical protein
MFGLSHQVEGRKEPVALVTARRTLRATRTLPKKTQHKIAQMVMNDFTGAANALSGLPEKSRDQSVVYRLQTLYAEKKRNLALATSSGMLSEPTTAAAVLAEILVGVSGGAFKGSEYRELGEDVAEWASEVLSSTELDKIEAQLPH